MPERAYAQLEVKAFDASGRRFSGMATTPTPDRQGDIIEPLGVSFANPLPLLLFHDQRTPVGTVTLGTPTTKGIPFEAEIPEVTEPGAVKESTDKAAHMVKYRLIRGVSIGWRPMLDAFGRPQANAIERTKDGHSRFLKSEVFELSLVPIPANVEASIHAIKAYASDDPAAFGAAVRADLPAGDSASPRRDSRRTDAPMENLSDRITDLQTTRRTTSDRMKSIMAPVLTGGTLDDAAQTEYDGLTKTLNDTDTMLRRLEALERADALPSAVPVRQAGFTPRIEVVEPKLPEGIGFTRAVICQMAGKMFSLPPWEIAKARYPSHPSIQMYLKAAVAGATTTDSTWAAPLVATSETLVGEFLEYLRPKTIVGRIPNITRVPFNSRVQSQTSGGSASWVGQAKQKPVTKFGYAAITLTWSKVAAITVLADELIRFSSPSAETRVRNALTATIVERLDTDFIDPTKAAVANVSPASITNGLTPLTKTGSGTLENTMTDIKQAVGHFVNANLDPTDLVWIMPNTTALALSLLVNDAGGPAFPGLTVTGGTFMGFPVVASQYAAMGSPVSQIVILAKASEIFLADDGGVSIDASNQASIEMSSDPENESGTVVSMYQTNQVALRAERYINWARGRNESVTYFADVDWGA